eukprot:3663970-Rhodomonas_salina.1
MGNREGGREREREGGRERERVRESEGGVRTWRRGFGPTQCPRGASCGAPTRRLRASCAARERGRGRGRGEGERESRA